MATVPARPAGSNTVNAFVMTDDAAALIDFVTHVFGVGDSMITVADRKPDWPFTPAFNRVYVDDVEATLARAEGLGARIVTNPTDFFGDVFSRFQDPQGNLWWVYRHNPAADDASGWSETADSTDEAQGWSEPDAGAEAGEGWESFTSPELEYIHSTLVEAMATLRDPRA